MPMGHWIAPAPTAPAADGAPHPFDVPLPPWQVLASRPLLRDRWLSLRADTCQLPGGPVLDPFYVLEERDWVHVFALDHDGTVPVVRQYRHGAAVATIELPGGIVDEGETPLQAARRELLEETGLQAADWHDAGWLHANPARQTNRVHLFLARGLGPARPPTPDEGEQIEVARASPARIRAWIADGRWSQSMHVASFLLGMEATHALGWWPATARSGARHAPSPVAQSSP